MKNKRLRSIKIIITLSIRTLIAIYNHHNGNDIPYTMYLLYSGTTVKCWWTENLLLAQTVILSYHKNTDKAIYRLQLHCTFQETSCCSWLSLPFSVLHAYRRWNNHRLSKDLVRRKRSLENSCSLATWSQGGKFSKFTEPKTLSFPIS